MKPTKLNTFLSVVSPNQPLDVAAVNRNRRTTITLATAAPQAVHLYLWSAASTVNLTGYAKGVAWAVREAKEFFGLFTLKTADSRNLLLDYSNTAHPLQKQFPVQGVEEAYFNFYTNQVGLVPTNMIEL